jgi:hypothetical protein
VLDTSCAAACLCDTDTGFGGADCSLGAAETTQRDTVRTALCQAIVDTSLVQDESTALLTTLTNSLLSSFNAVEVFSSRGVDVCGEALNVIATLSSSGVLSGDRTISKSLADVISRYTVKQTPSVRRRLAVSNATQYPVDTAVNNLVGGVLLGMVEGEDPLQLASDNLQLEVSNVLVTSLSDRILSTPPTAAQSFYGAISPKLVLGPDGLSSCYSAGSGYAQLSLLRWGNNPYANSESIKAPLLRFSGQFATSTNTTTTADKVIIPLPGVPAYTISLQFSAPQDFNFTAGLSGLRKSNFTIPACTLYNGVKYIACLGCNISSYTNTNVTYGCFDVTQLCPSQSASQSVSGRRSLESIKDVSDVNINPRGLRNLAEDSSEDISTYGVLIDSIRYELSSTLSSNPFALDLSQAVAILSFMGALIGFIVISLLILLRIDHQEKVHKIYVKSEHRNQARKRFQADISNGGKGDWGALYAGSIQEFKMGHKQEGIRSLEVLNDDDNGNDGIAMREEIRKKGYAFNAAVVVDFMDSVVPNRSLFKEKKGRNILNIIVLNHDYFKVFSGASMTMSRFCRFVGFIIIVLSEIFTDTLFFGIFYPSDGTCTVYTTEVRNILCSS